MKHLYDSERDHKIKYKENQNYMVTALFSSIGSWLKSYKLVALTSIEIIQKQKCLH